MFSDINALIQLWLKLDRTRSSCVDRQTNRHVQIWLSPDRKHVLMQGTDPQKRLCPDVVFSLNTEDKLDKVNCLWSEDQESELELIHDILQRLVYRSFEKHVVNAVQAMPREAWKDTTIGTVEFYSSPLDKDVLWLRDCRTIAKRYPFEVDLTEKVVSFEQSDDDIKLNRMQILDAIKVLGGLHAKPAKRA